jgi:hypothetical protein
MTQDEIIEMAKQAGASRFFSKDSVELGLTSTAKIEAFAKLVAAKEREACAKVCEEREQLWKKAGLWGKHVEYEESAIAIRARGEA